MPASRARGRGQMIPKGQNRWLLRVFEGRDATGKRIYRSRTFEGTTSQARIALTAYLREKDVGGLAVPSQQTFGEFADHWLSSRVDLAASTRMGYSTVLRGLKKPLGHRKVSSLTRQDLQSAFNGLGVAPSTLRFFKAVAKSVLAQAVEDRILQTNPCEGVILPRKVKRAPTILTQEQVALLLRETAGDRLGPLWRFQLTTGWRPGETCALTWASLDLDHGWASVKQVLAATGSASYGIEARAKADSQRRTGLPRSTVEALKRLKVEQARERLSAGPRWQDNDLVFCTPLGAPLKIQLLSRRWRTMLRKLALPEGVRMYDCRHTHLTHLLAEGADIAWVADRAGHADIGTTRDHYAHVLPEVHREMGEMTERMLARHGATA